MDTTCLPSLTLRQLLEKYHAHAEKYYRRRSGAPTREHINIRAALDRFELFAGEASEPTRINRHQVRAWLDQLAAEQLSRSYVNQCLEKLRRFVNWATDLDYLPLDVSASLRLVRPLQPFRTPAKEPKPRAIITPEQIAAISLHLPRWARDVVQLLTLCAARPGEIIEITNAEVHLDEHARLTPLQHKSAHRRKSRVIPLTAPAIAIIQRWHRPFCPSDPLFFAPRSTTLTTSSLDTAWSRARSKAGLPAVQIYDIRRTAARRTRREHGLDAAQALLGHADASTTEIYAPLEAGDIETFNAARRAAEGLTR